MKQLASIISLFVPGLAIAHPGHAVTEQLHSLIHVEHLFVIGAVFFVLAMIGIIKKQL